MSFWHRMVCKWPEGRESKVPIARQDLALLKVQNWQPEAFSSPIALAPNLKMIKIKVEHVCSFSMVLKKKRREKGNI